MQEMFSDVLAWTRHTRWSIIQCLVKYMRRQSIFSRLGEASKKKYCFFSEKLRNSETPPPLSAIRKPQFFLIRKFRNWRDPPPFWRKIPKYSQFFFDNIPMDWVRAPFLAKISQSPHFL